MLAACYLVHGGEPLQTDEFVASIKAQSNPAVTKHVVVEINNQYAWEQLSNTYQNFDLFAQHTVLELRLHGDQLNKLAAQALEQLLQQQNSALCILVRAGKLKPQTLNASWVQYIQRHGQIKVAKSIPSASWPGWVRQRLQQAGFSPSVTAIAALAAAFEGNLPALRQCIDQLSDLLPSGNIDLPQIEPFLQANAHFSVFSLSSAILAGDKARVLNVFHSLQNEGVDPILMLWVITREIRTLVQLKYHIQAGESLAQSAQQLGIWREALPNIKSTLDRLTTPTTSPKISLESLLRSCKSIDSMLKGITPGHAYAPLLAVCLQLSGTTTLTIEEPIL